MSTTSLAVAVGGDVSVALLIDQVHESLGLLRRAWVYVSQQAIQGAPASANQARRIVNGLGRCSVHLSTTILAQASLGSIELAIE